MIGNQQFIRHRIMNPLTIKLSYKQLKSTAGNII